MVVDEQVVYEESFMSKQSLHSASKYMSWCSFALSLGVIGLPLKAWHIRPTFNNPSTAAESSEKLSGASSFLITVVGHIAQGVADAAQSVQEVADAVEHAAEEVVHEVAMLLDEGSAEDDELSRLPAMEQISAQELRDLMANTPNISDVEESPVVVVNVLGGYLYGDCHIPNSINIPLNNYGFPEKAKEWEAKGWHETKTVVVYCALDTCDASEKAYYMLKGMGFQHVLAYEGGIREWVNLGYPAVGPCALDYLKPEFSPEGRICPCKSIAE